VGLGVPFVQVMDMHTDGADAAIALVAAGVVVDMFTQTTHDLVAAIG